MQGHFFNIHYANERLMFYNWHLHHWVGSTLCGFWVDECPWHCVSTILDANWCKFLFLFTYGYHKKNIIVKQKGWNLHSYKLQNLWMLTSWICKCAYLSSPCKHKHQRLWLNLFDINPMTKLWVTINNNALLT
jgi:hypothetical protein